MAKRKKPIKKPSKKTDKRPLGQRIKRGMWRWAGITLIVLVVLVLAGRVINPPTTAYMYAEGQRLGGVDHQWVPLNEVAPVLARSIVAAEDANFCNHWGFDVRAIQAAIGSNRGASTVSQQTVKNVYLWQGRSWIRKALEAVITPVVEIIWPKRRILEMYLNVAEFDEGVFGVEAAARHYFKRGPDQLTPQQAAQLAAVLPSPKKRSASNPTASLRKRAAQIRSGAATIGADGRAACFES